jgi:flagellar protein FliO/FliZ
MAQRLEAALRRPATEPAARSPDQARGASEPAGAEDDYAPAPPARGPAPAATRPARADAKPAAGKSLYDSLEQEMASLLGRPDKKP